MNYFSAENLTFQTGFRDTVLLLSNVVMSIIYSASQLLLAYEGFLYQFLEGPVASLFRTHYNFAFTVLDQFVLP